MSLGDETPARARARAWAATVAAARRRTASLLPDALAADARKLRDYIAQLAASEVATGRLFPWLPVAFIFGVVGYFSADREPAVWAAFAAALVGIAVAVIARRRPIAFPLALAFAAMAAGFATATIKAALIAHPVLNFPASGVEISGFVEVREERAKTDRIVVRVHTIAGPRLDLTPERVRLAVKKGTAPAVGQFIELKARLTPPLQPLRPGGYDFARDMYFQRLGASGYALGAIRVVAPPVAASLGLRYAATVDGLRDAIDKRIRAVVPGDRGSIASALITGKRDAISEPVNDAMYVSSLAHVLSISGYHMAVVAGLVFFMLRASLALVPSIASRYPIKKWAALCALVAAAFYLLLSGAEVATQRSFIMIAIVLVGVMFDRAALTFRTLSIAAFGVLLLAPESVVHPSFQMSFAATLALVAAYQYGLPWQPAADTSFGARIALWGGREIAGLILASMVAGFATTLFAAYHFHRLAPYGVLANLLAMPVVSAWVMPMGILGAIVLPFGFDGVFWKLMGEGIGWMIFVAQWVANLPGAVGRVSAFGVGPLLLGTAALLLICLLRTPLRWSGAIVMVAATAWAATVQKPDVLVASEGETAAIRAADGRLRVLHSGRDTFAVKEWLAADADGRPPKDENLKDGVRCDDDGCLGRLANGTLVSMALAAAAFPEDCARAAVVLSTRDAPGDCKALLIDRKAWRAQGATVLRWNGRGFDAQVARPAGYQRPWTRKTVQDRENAPASSRIVPRDATPRPEHIEPGD